MPESADEAMMASDDIRDELIAKAASLWTHVHADAARGRGRPAAPPAAGAPRRRAVR